MKVLGLVTLSLTAALFVAACTPVQAPSAAHVSTSVQRLLSLQVAPGGGHQLKLSKVQQLPGSFQQPPWPTIGASARGASSITPLQLLSKPSHCSL